MHRNSRICIHVNALCRVMVGRAGKAFPIHVSICQRGGGSVLSCMIFLLVSFTKLRKGDPRKTTPCFWGDEDKGFVSSGNPKMPGCPGASFQNTPKKGALKQDRAIYEHRADNCLLPVRQLENKLAQFGPCGTWGQLSVRESFGTVIKWEPTSA